MELIIDLTNESEIVLENNIINQIEFAIKKVLESENITKPCEISFLVTDNLKIKSLNKEFRSKDEATDVLSFPQYEPFVIYKTKDLYLYLGDVVISAEKVTEQALNFGHSFEREMVYLTVHSILHLIGYDHMVPDEQVIMRNKEKEILKSLGIFKEVSVDD